MFSTRLKILKKCKIPFEKMLYIASMSTEITECVNLFWKDIVNFTSPTFLHINADELMSIFIYLIIKSQMSDILIHIKFIEEFTSNATKKTMIGYYTTTLEAAIEYIQRGLQLKTIENIQLEEENEEFIDSNYFLKSENIKEDLQIIEN